MKADLHLHSRYSDGSHTVEEVLKQASNAGLTHVSFVDHDTVAGWQEIEVMANKYCIQAIPGIEISAYDFERGRKVHILGYDFQKEAPHIKKLCQPLLDRRQENSLWQIEQIQSLGYSLDTDLIAYVAKPSSTIYKQHIMGQLTEENYSSQTYKELYRQLFKGDGVAARDIKYVDAFDAVRAIKADGGIPVVAHPGQLDSYELIPELVETGLAGIEKIHPDHTKEDHRKVGELAERFHLIQTGGTDFHGAYGIDISPGDLVSPSIPVFMKG
ncbi:hypothetical protein SAMN04487944_102117 [Gracilibacillus ureilyticus]|uniref:Polymerase/histidinol phosphatase N-terminal domain-containing protein n=1 Tax=Gracilibacillus ureilyticus TaxID=531814 RepID=A0A1H9MR37_9BACI|nr:PHP domain-containing protein [Gracilibacillus ureilyticus]SER26174.1 hypothetical protein SAMN04487944_102117 [Gracilibacillus ureilyticus]